MDPDEGSWISQHLCDDVGVINQIYQPFYPLETFRTKKISQTRTKQAKPIKQFAHVRILELKNEQFDLERQSSQDIKQKLNKDLILSKILKNKQQQSKFDKLNTKNQKTQINSEQFYSFGFDAFLAFHDTPEYKQSLLSPLSKFCKTYHTRIQQLYRQFNPQQKFRELHLKSSPVLWKDQPGAYFMGIAINFKNKNQITESLFFNHLAIFVEPFNDKIWLQYCDSLKKMGMLQKCYQISKTGFLFNPNTTLGQIYLDCGDKIQIPHYELRGMLSSLKEPQKYESILIQSATLQLKHRTWRGLSLLFAYCNINDFKSSLNTPVIALARMFQSLQMNQISLFLLKILLRNKLPRYQCLNLYIQMVCRKYQGNVSIQELNFIQSQFKNLGPENRYRAYLDLVQIVRGNKKLQKLYLQQALKSAKKYSNQQISRKRAYKHIYLAVISFFSIEPEKKILNSFRSDEGLIFLANKARFVRGQKLQIFSFRDWKYYLHYSLDKNDKLLKESYQEFHQGRILAQYFHVIRIKRDSNPTLKAWRKKIGEAPKSGQLWCEGGRIFLELNQYSNAKKCLQAAIHFTPQYGDSFFQLLKIFLMESSFLQMNQLYKSYLISEPFYGNVYSFLRLSHYDISNCKLSHHQIWQLCKQDIQRQIYSGCSRQKMLTAYQPYNQAFISNPNPKVRQKLFMSYQLISTKSNK